MTSTRTIGAPLVTGVLVAGLALKTAPVGATHCPGLTDDETKCELASAKAFGKLASGEVGCINRCWAALRKGDSRFCKAPDLFAIPSSDPRTVTSATGPLQAWVPPPTARFARPSSRSSSSGAQTRA